MDVAIGMEFKSIPDSAISASSMESTTFHPRNARLHQNIGGGGWCAQETLLDQPQYLQVDLERNWALIAVATQGIQSMESWVTQYYLSTTFDRKVWVFAHDFTGKKVRALLKVMTSVTRGPYLESPETLRAIFKCHNSFCTSRREPENLIRQTARLFFFLLP